MVLPANFQSLSFAKTNVFLSTIDLKPTLKSHRPKLGLHSLKATIAQCLSTVNIQRLLGIVIKFQVNEVIQSSSSSAFITNFTAMVKQVPTE